MRLSEVELNSDSIKPISKSWNSALLVYIWLILITSQNAVRVWPNVYRRKLWLCNTMEFIVAGQQYLLLKTLVHTEWKYTNWYF